MSAPALAVDGPTCTPSGVHGARRAMPVGAVLTMSSAGVLLVAIGYAAGRSGAAHGMVWFWLGQALVFVPVLVRVMAGRLRESQAFALVIGLAVNGYALRWAYSPDQLRFSDELQHWFGTDLVLSTGTLFAPNDALPPAAHFPGLAEMGAAVARMTGLPVTATAFIVAGVLHLTFVGAIFILVRRCGGGPTTAALTCVIYATGLHFLFFDSMYVYQTAALPFLVLTLWSVRQCSLSERGALPFAIVAATSIMVVTVTHHVTAIVLVVTLTGIAVLEWFATRSPDRARSADHARSPDRARATALAAAFAAVCVGGWIAFVARDSVSYLGTPIAGVFDSALALVHGGHSGGTASGSGPWVLAVQAAGFGGLAVAFVIAVRTTGRIRTRDPWLIATLIGAGLFFAGGLLRVLSSSGPELGARAATFTYLPLAAVAAVVILGRRARAIGLALVITLAIGARLGGWPPASALLPGSYLPAAQERSVEPLGVSAATWASTHLPPGSRVAADLTGATLVSTYGRQDPVGQVAPLYDGATWTAADTDLTRNLAIGYLWVDTRLAAGVPTGHTLFLDDPRAGERTSPLPADDIAKFDTTVGFSRVFDDGAIRLYQVGAA